MIAFCSNVAPLCAAVTAVGAAEREEERHHELFPSCPPHTRAYPSTVYCVPDLGGGVGARCPPGRRITARPAVRGVALQPRPALGRPRAPRTSRLLAATALISVIVKLDAAPLASYAGGLPAWRRRRRASPARPGSMPLRPTASAICATLISASAISRPRRAQRSRKRACWRAIAMSMAARPWCCPKASWRGWRSCRASSASSAISCAHVDTDRSPQFIGADVIWRALAANPSLGDGGQGVIVGVIDTGIWPEHPSFADDGSYPPPPPPAGTAPAAARTTAHAAFTCNNKLIGAR